MKANFDIFVSHAASDQELADALRTVVCDSLGLDKNRVFISSDKTSLRLGAKGEKQITDAHRAARAVIALMTPQSIFRPWVVYESGGANFNVAKPLFVVLARGATVDCLPAPLKDWQAGYLDDRRCIQNLCESLRQALTPKLTQSRVELKSKQVNKLIAMASVGSGDWESVNLALVADKAAKSPFNMDGLFGENLPEAARKEVYMIGQNLHYITRESNEERFRKAIFQWLKNDRRRACRAMISDIDFPSNVGAWETIFGKEYEAHLRHSTAVFRNWVAKAKVLGLHFTARVTKFVPVTVTFVDPHNPDGYLILTPTTYKIISGERPHFVAGKKLHKAVFDYYWYASWEQVEANSKSLS